MIKYKRERIKIIVSIYYKIGRFFFHIGTFYYLKSSIAERQTNTCTTKAQNHIEFIDNLDKVRHLIKKIKRTNQPGKNKIIQTGIEKVWENKKGIDLFN